MIVTLDDSRFDRQTRLALALALLCSLAIGAGLGCSETEPEQSGGDATSGSDIAHDDHGHTDHGDAHSHGSEESAHHLLPTPDEARETGPRIVEPGGRYPGLHIGDAAPDLTLTDAEGESVSMRSLMAESTLIVLFYSGGWRDATIDHLRDWAEAESAAAEVGARLVAISPETSARMRETKRRAGAEFLFLTDPEGEAMKRYHVAFPATPEQRERLGIADLDLESWIGSGNDLLPAPAVFVVDRNGVVRWTYAGWAPDDRPEPQVVIDAADVHD